MHWLSPIDGDAMVLANQMIRFHQESEGLRYEELLAKCKEVEAKNNLDDAFLSVLEQRLDFVSRENDAEAKWSWWEKAQELRQQRDCESIEHYHRVLSEYVGVPAYEIGTRLYADVPEQRVIHRFNHLLGDSLLREFNFQQLVFFLSEAHELEFSFPRANEKAFLQAIARASLAPIYRVSGKVRLCGSVPGPGAFTGKAAKKLLAASQNLLSLFSQMSDWQLELKLSWKGKPVVLLVTADTLKVLNIPKSKNLLPLWPAPLSAGCLVSHAKECYVYADFLLSQTEEGSWGKIFYPWQTELLDDCLSKQVFTAKCLLILDGGLKASYKKKLEAYDVRVLWFDQIPDEQAIIAYLNALPA